MRNFGFAVLFLSLAGCSGPNSESTSAHADHDTAQHHDADHDDIGHAAVEKASNETDHEDEDHGDDTRCLLYTSPSPRDATLSRMPSSA